MKKILIIFGTRPEAIKLSPLVKKLQTSVDKIEVQVCVTAQHREMLDQVLELFDIKPDFDLDLMTHNQDLAQLSSNMLTKLYEIMQNTNPDIVVVQGDTLTTFIGALAAFYLKIQVAHVEAGLRTYNKYQPYPEEVNRRMVSQIADYHFAPTKESKLNLLKEGISESIIWETGNTGVDALLEIIKRQKKSKYENKVKNYFLQTHDLDFSDEKIKTILVTGHRRENFGTGLKNICLALNELALKNPEIRIIYVAHLNPHVQDAVHNILDIKTQKNIFVLKPLAYGYFVYLLSRSYLILTDSGGIQEEAPYLGKPVLTLRNTTERPEGVTSGNIIIVGTDTKKIVFQSQKLLDNENEYKKMSKINKPYGDGMAVDKIAKILGGFSDIVSIGYKKLM